MKNLRELKAALFKAKEDGNSILKAVESAGRSFTDEELERLEALNTEVSNIEADISKIERAKELGSAFSIQDDTASADQGIDFNKIELGVNRETLDETCGFASMSEFASAVVAANPKNVNCTIDDRLHKMMGSVDAQQESGTNDGYLVPPEFSTKIWSVQQNQFSLFNMIDKEMTNSNHVHDLSDESTPWGGSGVQAFWGGEGQTLKDTKDDTKKRRSCEVNKLHAMVKATEELLSDAPRLQSRLTTKASEAINWSLDEAIVYGSGSNQPLGFFTSDALLSVEKEAGQISDTILPGNIADMYSRMLPSSINRAIWLVNSDCTKQLMQLSHEGNLLYVTPRDGYQKSPNGTLFSRPVIFSEHTKTLGDKGDIMFIDLKGFYGLQKVRGIKFAKSIHLYFDQDKTAFKWTYRFGGQPHLSAPIAPNNGSATKSHFVTLDERA